MTLSRMEAARLINQTKGKFFKVVFIKREDGSIRHMLARTGVHKHTRGGSLAYDPDAYALRGVWDCVEKGYRMVNLNAVLAFQCGKLNVSSPVGREKQHEIVWQ